MNDHDVDTLLRDRLEPFLGRDGPLRWSARPIETAAVWNFCEAVEDANPVYWDAEQAIASRFGRMIAPPQALMALNMAAWWLPDFLRERAEQREKELGPSPSSLVYDIVRELGFTTATNVTREEEYLEPFGPGDGRMGQTDRLVHVSDVKQTRVGRGVFLTTEIEYITEVDETVVAKARNVLLMYDGTSARRD
ncbi:MaoC family dehydratase N-terminal domain-containing protein [Pseudonocardia aurantiaca]|uniref:MaoC family dehydratase N-terminal domain-containing protein n=1 Tax=Pseudonocardia aurantiaca TaxID=75290 RepID=A0ABW4FRY1_9PSEU